MCAGGAKVVTGEAGRQWRKEQLKVRGRIEAKFSEQMNRHGLCHARYWGLSKVTMQVLLNVITVNANGSPISLVPFGKTRTRLEVRSSSWS